MSQLIEAAREAVRQGNKIKAVEILREILRANPNDVEGWLLLSNLVDQPERKRQCLERVLNIDPTNKVAREELLKLDRAAMGAPRVEQAQPVVASAFVERSSPSSVSQPDPVAPPVEGQKARPQPIPTPRKEKPRVFKYSIVTRIATYFFTVLFACGLLLALQDPRALLVPCGLFFLMLPAVWIVSGQVELSEKGIRTSRLFGLTGAQVGWDEIASIKSNSMGSNLQLVTKKGNQVKVTSQVSGYPLIVETLRQRRPDLFGAAALSSTPTGGSLSPGFESSPSTASATSTSASSFSGTKTFQKNAFKQYGLLLVTIPFLFLMVWMALSDPQYRLAGILSAVFCAIISLLPFFQVNSLKVEPDKLTIETFFEQKEFSAQQIKEITMKSVRGRYGRVSNFVNIVPVEGKTYPLGGFSAGDEIIYGFLMNWWNTYRNG